MMQQLLYRIADHYIRLHTPDAQATAHLLQRNYAPFATDTIEEGGIVLLDIFGNSTLPEDPTEQLSETNQEGLAEFELFQRKDNKLRLKMKINEVERNCLLSSDRSKLYLELDLTKASEQIFFERMIMVAFRMVITNYSMFQIHSSATMVGDKALLFLGVSGTGKSTHSRLWREFVPNAELLNDDEPIVRLLPDGSVRVYGCPWSGSTPCYRNKSAEVVAFVHLEQAPHNQIQQLRGREALNALFISIPALNSDSELQMRNFTLMADTLEKKPVFRLECRPDEEAVRLTEKLLQGCAQ